MPGQCKARLLISDADLDQANDMKPKEARGIQGPVAVVVAVDFESGWLMKQGTGRKVVSRKPFPVTQAKLGAMECLVAVSGVGKINASATTAFVAEHFRPAVFVSLGIGGAYPDTGLVAGQVVLASEEILPDEGVFDSRGRFLPLESGRLRLVSGSRLRRPNRFPIRRELLTRVRKQLAGNLEFRTGACLTVSTATGTDDRALQLRTAWQGLCENMEGGAVAQIAERFGIPFLEVRGISNAVGRRNLRLWKKELAAENAQQALYHLLGNPEWMKGLPG